MKSRAFLAAMAAAWTVACPLAVSAEVVTGSGTAPVTRDANAVRAVAEDAARLDLARSMTRQILGAERMAEVDPGVMRRLAGQIRDDMIVDRSADRVGRDFRVSLSADIDRAWFQQKLDDEGVRSSSAMAGGATQRIIVMLDESVGPALDAAAPAERTTTYFRDNGASASDTSSLSYSERERAVAAHDSSRASMAGATGRSGYVGPFGAGGSSGTAVAASASRDRGVAAYGRDESLEVRNNVQAERHDVTFFNEHVVYQTTATTQAGQMAVAALTSEMIRHDISTTNATATLARFRPGRTPLFADLRDKGDLVPFMDYASREADAPFLMGGQMQIAQSGRQPATGYAVCTGSLRAQAFATSNGADIGAATASGEQAAATYELCSARLAESLATQAAETLGPQIQRYWRTASRNVSAAVNASAAGADYTLTVRGSGLDMAAQADLMDALAGMQGVSRHAFIAQGRDQISVQVSYQGSTPLHLALYQKLRGIPTFAHATAQAEGRSVLMCLDGC